MIIESLARNTSVQNFKFDCLALKSRRKPVSLLEEMKEVVLGGQSGAFRHRGYSSEFSAGGDVWCNSFDDQARVLIDLATDRSILGRAWFGWLSHL